MGPPPGSCSWGASRWCWPEECWPTCTGTECDLLFALNLSPLVLTIRLLPTDAVEGRHEGQPGGGMRGGTSPPSCA